MVSYEPLEPGAGERETGDADLMAQAQAGEPEPFMELVQRYRHQAYRISYRLVGRREDARDVVQETFLRIYRSLGRYDRKKPFSNWLYQIVVNLSIDHLRREGRRESFPLGEADPASDPAEAPERLAQSEEERDGVRAILDLMPIRYRLPLLLRHFEDLDSRQIAKLLHCNRSTARWRLHKARQLFKTAWTARFGPKENDER